MLQFLFKGPGPVGTVIPLPLKASVLCFHLFIDWWGTLPRVVNQHFAELNRPNWNLNARIGTDVRSTRVPWRVLLNYFVACRQCDKIGWFIALWPTFQSLWQQLFSSNCPHLRQFFKGVKIFHFSSEFSFVQLL